MIQTLKIARAVRRPMLVVPTTAKRYVKPPALKLLPRRARTRGLLLSSALHAVLIAGLIWLPALFPSPVIVSMNKPEVAAYEPLFMPELPRLTSSSSGSVGSEARTPRAATGAESPAADAPPLKRDYIAPQEIVSEFPNAVNRVQTIRRPDLVSPPDLKFPLRLQSVVIL